MAPLLEMCPLPDSPVLKVGEVLPLDRYCRAIRQEMQPLMESMPIPADYRRNEDEREGGAPAVQVSDYIEGLENRIQEDEDEAIEGLKLAAAYGVGSFP